MPYDTKNVITSEKPYQVLRFILGQHEKGGSYSVEIAREMDMTQQQASEIVNKLSQAGVIKKGKRTRAQYYHVDGKGFVELFIDLWAEKLEENSEASTYLEEFQDRFSEELSENFPELLARYVGNYCASNESSNIEKMLLDDFYLELSGIANLSEEDLYILEDFDIDSIEEIPDWLKELYAILWLSRNPSSNLFQALHELQDN
jgi:DNA-binding MarR family transcriptional regulator